MTNPDSPFSGTTAPGGAFGVITVSESDLTRIVGTFLMRILGLPKASIVVGQVNRVAQPGAANFIVMTPQSRTMLSTTTRSYDADVANVERSTQFAMQIDIYGPGSAENAQIVTTLFRDEYAATFMDGSGLQPLYCEAANQAPLIDAEMQYEDRWTITAYLQGHPSVSTPAQFADSVIATLIEADS